MQVMFEDGTSWTNPGMPQFLDALAGKPEAPKQ